jgi:hypothetical protein
LDATSTLITFFEEPSMRAWIIVLCFFVSNSVFAEEDACSVVLERAATNISYRFGSATSASTQADALCDERYDKMSTSDQQGFEASYKLFSASYSSAGSSLKEYRSKYCRSGSSSFFATSQSTDYSNQIYGASVEAWRDCKAMQSANVIISPVRTPDDRSVTISIAYRGHGSARLTGVRISPQDSFSCLAEDGVSISGSVDKTLSGDSFSFDCTRTVKLVAEPGGFSADAASITVTTSATTRPFMLYFPAVANPDIRTDNATQLRKSIDELITRTNTLVNNLQVRADGLQNSVQVLQSDLARRSRIAWKIANNGTKSCQQYCNEGHEGFSGECVTAIINFNNLNSCNAIPGGPTHCLCATRQSG